MWLFVQVLLYCLVVEYLAVVADFRSKDAPFIVTNPRINRTHLWYENRPMFWVTVIGETPMRIFDFHLSFLALIGPPSGDDFSQWILDAYNILTILFQSIVLVVYWILKLAFNL